MRYMTQKQLVLDYMREHGSITHRQCERYCGSTRLPARIKDLEDMGHRINRERIKVTCRGGRKTYITRYSLDE